jgi:murein DD-endopeptidase MepM/ murein hydrolase activator NlpD
LIPKRKPGKPRVVMERRSLYGVVLAFVIPLVAVAGYRALKRGRSAPPPAKPAVSLPSVPVAPKFQEFSDKFHKNETITDALMRHGLTKQEVFELVKTTRSVWPRSKVIAGEDFQGNLYPNGEFHEFRYRLDSDRYITVYRDGDKFVPLVKTFNYETRTVAINAVIRDSLFVAVNETGEQDQLADQFNSIFGGDVDFYTDIHKGDSFRMLFEKKYLDGEFIRYGNILAAELAVQKKRLSAFRFQNEYYDLNGKALRRSLLKSPLKYTRISSRFSNARLDPILKIVQPHRGVDYAAPTGTPVVAVAAGRVLSAGENGGYGLSVCLRHANGYETVYSHLSHIAVHVGQQVAQGQLIGNVGATGLATGPHLDFRLMHRETPVNPTRMIAPEAPPVAAKLFARFAALRDDLRGRLDQLAPRSEDVAQAAKTATGEGHTRK